MGKMTSLTMTSMRSHVKLLAVVAALTVHTAALAPQVEARDPAAPFAGRLLMESRSGTVLFESEAHRAWPPASMVKLMGMLLVMEAVAGGQVSLEDPVTTSARASRTGGSQVYLRQGEVFPLGELLKALIIASANDAAVAIAEHIAGTAEAFVELMNERARQLGLKDTIYRSVHGLPPASDQEDDLSSAYDLAVLARKAMEHAEIMKWASQPEESFRDGTFKMTNTNHLIRWYRGATGLKTGYHGRSGFGVTATATRGNLTLIAVVLGAGTKAGCFDEAARILTEGFSTYRLVEAAEKGRPVGATIPVEGGDVPEVSAIAGEELRLLLKRAEAPDPRVEARVPRLLVAPVRKGQPVGEVAVVNGSQVLGTTGLVVDRDVMAVGWLGWWRNWQGPQEESAPEGSP